MIRPIEMQMLLPRTESVGSEQQSENQKVMNENAFAAREVAQEVRHNSEAVVEKDRDAFTQYQYDAKEKGNGTYQDPRKKKRRKPGQESDGESLEHTDQREHASRINIQI